MNIEKQASGATPEQPKANDPWAELSGSPWNNIENTTQQTRLNGEPIQPVEGTKLEQEQGNEAHRIKLIEKFEDQAPEIQASLKEKIKTAVSTLSKLLVETGAKALVSASIPLTVGAIAVGGIAGMYLENKMAAQKYAVESHNWDQDQQANENLTPPAATAVAEVTPDVPKTAEVVTPPDDITSEMPPVDTVVVEEDDNNGHDADDLLSPVDSYMDSSYTPTTPPHEAITTEHPVVDEDVPHVPGGDNYPDDGPLTEVIDEEGEY